MITKLRKAQDSWAAKAVFTLTALSFVSLFGVSGYLNSAAENPAVIKVNDNGLSLAEFNQQIDEQIRMARRLFGDNIEVTDEIRNSIASELVQKNLSEMIVKEVAGEKKIYVSDTLIRNIIFSQPQFRDENGKFNRAAFQNFLSTTNWSEQKYINMIRDDIVKSFLITNPVNNIKVSKTMADLVAKAESQRKIFKYVEIDTSKMKIDREISNEEIEQYYNDFGAEFINPETRDISVIDLTFEDFANQVEVSEEEIKEFYNTNFENFETPETREVLQILSADKETAQKAAELVKSGADFYETAETVAEQNKEDTEFGFVSKDMLIENIAEDVFAAAKGDIVGPIESELGWHVIKVKDIKAGSKTDENTARKQIVEALKTEKAYETAYDVTKEIEDKLGAGASLEDVAKDLSLTIKTINGVKDTDSSPYVESAFSYNKDEISQAVENDNGFAFIRVDNVVEAHQQDIATATPKIKMFWEESEKSAIAQEVIHDVMNDIENGDKIADVASRYKLKLETTEALTRSQSFADLSQNQMVELFNDKLNVAKQFTVGNKTIIAMAVKDAKAKEMSEEDMDIINRRMLIDINQEASTQLINSYGNNYDVRVKYRQLGLAD